MLKQNVSDTFALRFDPARLNSFLLVYRHTNPIDGDSSCLTEPGNN